MSLSDIMSHEQLSLLPQAALVIFLIAFGVVAARTFRRHNAAERHEAARLPLADDGSFPTRD